MIILLVIVAAAVCMPLAAVVLVSLASLREDSAQSLASGPSGAIEAAGRRLVGFHGDAIAHGTSPRRPTGARHPRGADEPDPAHLAG